MKTGILVSTVCMFTFLGFLSCAQQPPFTPFTAELYERLRLDNTTVSSIQVYYRAKKREIDAPRTRDTRFAFETSAEAEAVTLGKTSVLAKETVTTREDIVLYNGTPGVIVDSEKAGRKRYVLKVDFGDGVLLEFENNRADRVFYLVTKRILLGNRAFVIEEGYYGYLVLEAEQRSTMRTDRKVYEVRGKVLE